ncbi:unnamed protein product [Lymnaea stagnalis]|uniref:Uncharacterized protein n=1 Tax=Lymnaea stagnalis TaxID=6523 RepID=A0AAV2HK41_LYMST
MFVFFPIPTDDCYFDKGRWYNGTVNVTKSGHTCQRWEDKSPQKHDRSPLYFPELYASDNHCRNPGGEERQPWCYTTNKLVRWEVCDIDPCETANIPADDMTRSDDIDDDYHEQLIIILVPVLFCCLLIPIIGLLVKWKKTQYSSTTQDDVDIDVENLPINSAYHQMKSNRLNPKLETLEFPRNDIVFIEDIGQGAFGRVFKARIKEVIKYSEGQLIAIKMLKEDASDTVQADFEREASLMVEFDHPNIVRLLGVCTIGKPMCLLFEYMNKGDLNEFLRLCSPDQCLRRSDAGSVPSLDDVSSIDIVDQLHMARQICNGMVYLSERGYVHRDLATRNCLVSNSLTVKISDFGLARSVHSMDYYHGSDKDAIPIRWMPPEAILYNKFSSQSDVWSFGVLLWEIFSFALQPYYGMTHEQVINYLRAGHILELTENVTSVVYDIMKSCWHKKPTSRPTFVSLHKSLTVLYEEHSKQKARSAFSL